MKRVAVVIEVEETPGAPHPEHLRWHLEDLARQVPSMGEYVTLVSSHVFDERDETHPVPR